MATKEDYLILSEVLRKMEFDVNYKATYAEEAVLHSLLNEKYDGALAALKCDSNSNCSIPTDQTL